MTDLVQVVLLGIIEGITEFLPISSTGHLLIAEKWLGARSEVFNVVIQLGAILAVLVIYWRRLIDLATHLALPEQRGYVLKLAAAFLITAIGGLIAKKLGLKLPADVRPIAWALIVGALVMFVAEWRMARDGGGDMRIGWPAALAVGAAQIVAAIFPGTSRSAATIFAAMLVGGTGRAAATEFSFLLGIPTMFAASGFELLKLRHDPAALGNDTALGLAIGFVVSAVVAFAAVKWLLGYIQTHRFTAFAWYRLALGAALLLI